MMARIQFISLWTVAKHRSDHAHLGQTFIDCDSLRGATWLLPLPSLPPLLYRLVQPFTSLSSLLNRLVLPGVANLDPHLFLLPGFSTASECEFGSSYLNIGAKKLKFAMACEVSDIVKYKF
jgi:hypothetical protein